MQLISAGVYSIPFSVIGKKSFPEKPVGWLSVDCRPTDYTDRLPTGYWPTANRQATNSFPNRKFVVKTRKHDPETIIIPINITYLPIDGTCKRISFQDVYRKLIKCVADISLANLVTNRTISVITFESDLIQTSETKEESYFGSFGWLCVSLPNFKQK